MTEVYLTTSKRQFQDQIITQFSNIDDVAQLIHRPVRFILAYFSLILGTPMRIDTKVSLFLSIHMCVYVCVCSRDTYSRRVKFWIFFCRIISGHSMAIMIHRSCSKFFRNLLLSMWYVRRVKVPKQFWLVHVNVYRFVCPVWNVIHRCSCRIAISLI